LVSNDATAAVVFAVMQGVMASQVIDNFLMAT